MQDGRQIVEWKALVFQAQSSWVFALALLACFGIFAADVFLPLQITDGVPFIVVVLMGRWFSARWQVIFITVLSCALVVAGYVIVPDGGEVWNTMAERLIALAIIVLSAAITLSEKKEERARERSETLFHQVLDNAVSGIISINDRAVIQSFNRAAEEIFGYSAEEVIGQNVKMLMPDMDAKYHDAYVSNYIRTREAKIIGIGRQVEGLKKDGTVFPMELAISELNDNGQRLFTGTVTDISDRVEWEQALLEAKQQAELADQAKSEFLSSISHELRTPLNAIIGFTQLLQTDKDNPLSKKQIESTEYVLKSSAHLLSLIEQVLDLSAIESGQVRVEVETVNPDNIILDCAMIAENLARQQNITFFNRVANWDLPRINVDQTRFRQCLLNLLSNAVKYNREDGCVTFAVTESEKHELRFMVIDSGPGIAKEEQDRIFSPFSRLGQEGSGIPGTGIGLKITKELVEAMGGSIGFESTPNLGSTFWVDFPIVSGILSLRETPTDSDPITLKAQGKYTVLCVDDNPSSLKLMGSIVDRIPGVSLITAHTGELAIDLAEIHRPDVVLMDINLPGIDGFSALKQIHQSEVTKKTPVIALTARASQKDRQRGLQEGFHAYLTKPVNVTEVTAILNSTFKGEDGTGSLPN